MSPALRYCHEKNIEILLFDQVLEEGAFFLVLQP